MMRVQMLWSVVRILAFAYLGMCLFVFLFQRKYVYHPTSSVVITPESAGLTFQEVKIATEDGESICVWIVPARKADAKTILFCHGNGGNMQDRVEFMRIMNAEGMRVVAFDYRGYGKSTGSPSEAGTYRDVWAVWSYLIEDMGIPPRDIVVYGRSLGGAVGAWLARKVDCGALVLESTFTSADDMGARMFPFLPVRLLSRYGYRTEEYVRSVACPICILHSPEDEMVPFAQGIALAGAAGSEVRFIRTSGEHNWGGVEGNAKALSELVEFFQEVGMVETLRGKGPTEKKDRRDG